MVWGGWGGRAGESGGAGDFSNTAMARHCCLGPCHHVRGAHHVRVVLGGGQWVLHVRVVVVRVAVAAAHRDDVHHLLIRHVPVVRVRLVKLLENGKKNQRMGMAATQARYNMLLTPVGYVSAVWKNLEAYSTVILGLMVIGSKRNGKSQTKQQIALT